MDADVTLEEEGPPLPPSTRPTTRPRVGGGGGGGVVLDGSRGGGTQASQGGAPLHRRSSAESDSDASDASSSSRVGSHRRRSSAESADSASSASTLVSHHVKPQGGAPKVRRPRRRRSAPDVSGGARTAQSRREYHNKAERTRTRKINSLIQELRYLMGTPESDKATILAHVVGQLTPAAGGDVELELPSLLQVPPIFDDLQLGMTILDLGGRCLDCNECFAQGVGYSRTHVVGKQLEELVLPDDRPVLEAKIQSLLQLTTGDLTGVVTVRLQAQDGSTRSSELRICLVVGLPNQQGPIDGGSSPSSGAAIENPVPLCWHLMEMNSFSA